MSPLKSISTCYKKYATFSGRATRSELWYFRMYVDIIIYLTILLGLFTAKGGLLSISGAVIKILFLITHIIPYIAVGVRRLHDINKPGWWLLLNCIPGGFIVITIFFCLRGTPATNRFGEPLLLQ